MKKTILILGDSFAADWSSKSKSLGWVNKLSFGYDVTNLAQAGVSEYKIYLQLQSVNPNDYDYVIVSHTSAYRIPIQEHPIHKTDSLHSNCDIIYSDVEQHLDNPIMKTAYDFYCEIFNPDYFVFVNELIFDKIYNTIPSAKHITFFDSFYDDRVLKYESTFLSHKGNANHLNIVGNEFIYNEMKKILK